MSLHNDIIKQIEDVVFIINYRISVEKHENISDITINEIITTLDDEVGVGIILTNKLYRGEYSLNTIIKKTDDIKNYDFVVFFKKFIKLPLGLLTNIYFS